MPDRRERTSRLLAYVLRHDPGTIGIELDDGGWVDIHVMLDALAEAGHHLDEPGLRQLLRLADKQRYEVEGHRIRAAQGHSIPVELGLEPERPPGVLYHGTTQRATQSIRRAGLVPGTRAHVHLSADEQTARQVGSRRGRAVVVTVDARRMHRDGSVFFRAANGVWLVDAVAARYLRWTD